MDNKNLRAEVTEAKGKIFQLESDLDYLRTTIEKNLPFFNELEQDNRKLKIQVSNKTNKEKLIDKLQTKIRVLEKKLNGAQTEYGKTTVKLKSDVK